MFSHLSQQRPALLSATTPGCRSAGPGCMSSPPGVPPSLDGCAPPPPPARQQGQILPSVPLALHWLRAIHSPPSPHPSPPLRGPLPAAACFFSPAPGTTTTITVLHRTRESVPTCRKRHPSLPAKAEAESRQLYLPRARSFPSAAIYTHGGPAPHHPYRCRHHLPLYLCHEAFLSS